MAIDYKQKPSHYTVEIISISHLNEETGWFSGRCRAVQDPDHNKDLDFPGELSIAGVCPHVMEGLPYRLLAITTMYQGQKQLKAISGSLERVESLIDLAGIDRYLMWIRTILNNTRKEAGLPSLGIGPKKITDLVNVFGRDAVEALRANPEVVAKEVKGWKLPQAQAFSEIMTKHIKTENVLLELSSIGANGGLSAANRFDALDEYGFDAPDMIRKNPYRLIEDISGVGWSKADKIAVSNLGWEKSSPNRIVAGTVEALRRIEAPGGRGDTYAISQELFLSGSRLTGVPRSYHEMFATDDPGLTVQGPFSMSTGAYNAEMDITKIIQSRASAPELVVRFDHVDETIMDGLNKLQKLAYQRAMSGGFFVLTGGPGRGKTHVCKSIIDGLKNRNKKVLILAPTGRAAARAKELTGNQALTIHSYLRRLKGSTDFGKFGTIIVDESSMIDLRLMGSFVRTLKEHQSCIFVGDVDQLPPVSSGKPFIDIIKSQLLEVVHLEEIMRTDKLGLIQASQIVNTADHSKVADDLRYIQCDSFNLVPLDGQKARDAVVSCIHELQLKGVPSADIQVITATNGYKETLSGDVKLLSNRDFNGLCKPLLNSRGVATKATCKGGDILSTGDRVMNLKNDSSIPLMNGEMGVFVKVAEITNKNGMTEKKAVFDFGDGRILHKSLKVDDIMLAYAATCHKFQGSEARHVIVVAGKSAMRLLDRSWLYTAITRAKSSCILVAPSSLINKACGVRARVLERKTFLQARLEDNFDPVEIFEEMKLKHRMKSSTVDALLPKSTN